MKESYREDLARSSGLEPYAGHAAFDENYTCDGSSRLIDFDRVGQGLGENHYDVTVFWFSLTLSISGLELVG